MAPVAKLGLPLRAGVSQACPGGGSREGNQNLPGREVVGGIEEGCMEGSVAGEAPNSAWGLFDCIWHGHRVTQCVCMQFLGEKWWRLVGGAVLLAVL